MGTSLTIIDALDTLWIAQLHEEYRKALNFVIEKLDFVFVNKQKINLFELNVRVLGALLTNYNFSGEKILLVKAVSIKISKKKQKIKINNINNFKLINNTKY